MRSYFGTLSFLLLAAGILFSVISCSRSGPQETNTIPSTALKGSCAVYSTFSDLLSKGQSDNDFSKFANNPENYNVSIRDTGDAFVYTFVLKSYHGQAVLDGIGSFTWNKSDGKVTHTSKH
jgi:hypothetical protein